MKKRLTSLTLSAPSSTPGALVFHPRGELGTEGRIEFGGSSVAVALLNVPREKHPPMDVDVAHLLSTLKLCDIDGDLRVTFGEETTAPGARPPATLLDKLPALLNRFLLNTLLNGRLHCGSRVMAES